MTTAFGRRADGDASLARLFAIQPLATGYGRAGATAGLVVGSVARGWADRWSDVELIVVWPMVPPEPERRAIAATAGLEEWRAFPGADAVGATEEDGSVNGLKADIAHLSVDQVTAVLQRMVTPRDAGADLPGQRLAGSLQDATVVVGADWIKRLRQDLAGYPDGLARRTIAEQLIFGPDAWLQMLGERGDPIPLNDVLGRVGRALLTIWFALSQRYVRTTDGKWALHHVADLSVTPDDARRRLERMFLSPPLEAAGLARDLIDDTLVLVDRHLSPELTQAVRLRVAAVPRDPSWPPRSR